MSSGLSVHQRARFGVVGAVVVVNLLLLGIAAADHSWFAFMIATVIGPVVNGAIAVLLLIRTAAIRKATGMSVFGHVVLSIVAPCAAGGVDALIINSMQLRGC